jgi:hypothetical protein
MYVERTKNRIQGLDLDKTIEQNELKLISFLSDSDPEEDYEEFKKALNKKIEEDGIDDEWIEIQWASYATGGPDKYLVPFILSTLYTLLAEKAHSNEDSSKAWSLIAEAMYFRGLCQAPPEATLTDADKRIENASKGGLARAEKNRLAKEEAARLFKEKAPATGWSDIQQAIEGIFTELTDFIRRKSIKLASHNLRNLLKKWLSEDEALHAAYDANSFEKKSKSN